METLEWPWEERGAESSSSEPGMGLLPQCVSRWGACGLKEARNWDLYLFPFPLLLLSPLLSHFTSTMLICFQVEEQRLGILPWVSRRSLILNSWTFDSAEGTFSS